MPKISRERLLARERGIVQAAARCLQRNGLEGTGMRDLFRAANLSPGAVYRYFSSKEELVAAVAATSPTVTEAALGATEDVEDPADRLRRLLETAAAGGPAARLQLELQTAALHSPLVAAAVGERREETRRATAEALGRPGDAAADEFVELTLILCEGLARARQLEPEADVASRAEAAAHLLSAAFGLDRHAKRVA